jgi:hypothetical protein
MAVSWDTWIVMGPSSFHEVVAQLGADSMVRWTLIGEFVPEQLANGLQAYGFQIADSVTHTIVASRGRFSLQVANMPTAEGDRKNRANALLDCVVGPHEMMVAGGEPGRGVYRGIVSGTNASTGRYDVVLRHEGGGEVSEAGAMLIGAMLKARGEFTDAPLRGTLRESLSRLWDETTAAVKRAERVGGEARAFGVPLLEIAACVLAETTRRP